MGTSSPTPYAEHLTMPSVWDATTNVELMVARSMIDKMDKISKAHSYGSLNLQWHGTPMEFVQSTPSGVWAHYDVKNAPPSPGHQTAMSFGHKSSRGSTPSQVRKSARAEVGVGGSVKRNSSGPSRSPGATEQAFKKEFGALNASSRRKFVSRHGSHRHHKA